MERGSERRMARGGESGAAGFLKDILCGALIGVAFIIPGFSGGSAAAILGVYERIVDAVADIFRHFAKSIKTLFPVALGMLLGAMLLILPIRWGMENLPLPTVSLFMGLALGGLPPLRKKAGKGNGKRYALFFAAFAVAAALALIPAATRPADFLYDLDAGGYVLLFLVAFLASCALVVPGISGSMILLIFGYYTPLIALITDLLLTGQRAWTAVCVLLTAGVGILLGFFCVSAAMKKLLHRYPRATYFAILGLILGSVIAVYAPVLRAGGPYLTNAWYYLLAVLFLLVGAALSYSFLRFAERRVKLR